MAKALEVSVLNETTLLVNDVAVGERVKNKDFSDVVSDVIYVDDTDSTKTLRFITSRTRQSSYLNILPSKSLQSIDMRNDKFKCSVTFTNIKKNYWLYKVNVLNSDRVGPLPNYVEPVRKFKDDQSLLYEVQFMTGIKFDMYKSLKFKESIEIFVLNQGVNQGLYDAGVGLDFTFVIDGKEIKASKYTLGVNSYVFDAMVANDWKDSRECRVYIEDVEFEVMDTFIRALHGVVMKIKDITMALKLMMVADKYNVGHLFMLAEKYVNGMHEGNVIEALVVAHQLGLVDVREKCHNYIANCNKSLKRYENVPHDVLVLMFEALHNAEPTLDTEMYQFVQSHALAEIYKQSGIRADSLIEALGAARQLGLNDVQQKCVRYIACYKMPQTELPGYDKLPAEVLLLMVEAVLNKRSRSN